MYIKQRKKAQQEKYNHKNTTQKHGQNGGLFFCVPLSQLFGQAEAILSKAGHFDRLFGAGKKDEQNGNLRWDLGYFSNFFWDD